MSAQNHFDFWGVLDRRKWIVFLGMLAGIGLGVLYYYQTPTQYRSNALIQIVPRNPVALHLSRFGSGGAILPDAEDIMPYRHDKIIAEDITIRKCLDAREGALYKLQSFQGQDKEVVIDMVKENLVVTPDREDMKNYLIEYVSTNRDDTTHIVNNLVATYKDDLEKLFREETTNSYTHLKQVWENTRKDRDTVMAELERLYKLDTVPRVNNNTGQDMYSMAIGTLSPNVTRLKNTLQELTAERQRSLEALEMGVESTIAQVQVLFQNNKIRFEKSTNDVEFTANQNSLKLITDLEVNRDALRTRLGPGHPRVEVLENQLRSYHKMIEEQRMAAEQIKGGQSQEPGLILQYYIQGLDQQIETFTDMLQKDVIDLQRAVQLATEVQTIRNQIKAQEDRKDQIESRLEELDRQITEINPTGRFTADLPQKGFVFNVLRAANRAEEIWPILPVVLALGGLVGSLLGFGLGCLVDLADKTFHNPDEVIRHLGLPLIGHIPVITQGKRYQLEGSPIDTVVCVHHRPRSQSSEAFRAVRTALYFNTQGRDNAVIQVTSPTPGDGKSTIAANVAVSIAQSGKRVLLVDGDMRRPRLGAMFNIDSKEGFATVLSGETDWREVVFEVEEIEGLSVLPCGSKPSNPAELSTSPQVKTLIEQMRREYDFVVIDTPPLLAVTDPCPIAARVDGVILSMRIKKNVRISAERAVDILRNLGANVVGVVVNGVGAQTGYGSNYTYGAYRAGYSYNGYGYGSGYGYGYGQYYDENKKQESGRPAQKPRFIEAVPIAGATKPVVEDDDDDLGELDLD